MGVFLRFSVVIDAAIGLKFRRVSGRPLSGSLSGVICSPNRKVDMFVCD